MHPSLTKYSDKIRFDTDILHLDNDTMTRVVQVLNDNLMVQPLLSRLFYNNLRP